METMSSSLRLGLNSFKSLTSELIEKHKKCSITSSNDSHVLFCILKLREKFGDKEAKHYISNYKGATFVKLSQFQIAIPIGEEVVKRFLAHYSPFSVFQKFSEEKEIDEKRKKKLENILTEERKGYIYLTTNKICFFPLSLKDTNDSVEGYVSPNSTNRIIQFNISEIKEMCRVGPTNVMFKLLTNSSYLFCFVDKVKELIELVISEGKKHSVTILDRLEKVPDYFPKEKELTSAVVSSNLYSKFSSRFNLSELELFASYKCSLYMGDTHVPAKGRMYICYYNFCFFAKFPKPTVFVLNWKDVINISRTRVYLMKAISITTKQTKCWISNLSRAKQVLR
eukprot:TRINITY_DN3186_c0_g1_i1.p1 TRINITY_DN3186_c0_g1~~TRINITY_DN3186_c0_g1_i1.p1  ORF type:complete len:346 (-),score=83.86 TRINITY_DN3186_c0_g1_i1:162-1178(-)